MLKRASSLILMGFIIQAAIFSVPASVNAQTDADVERAVRARAAARRLRPGVMLLQTMKAGR